MVSATSGKPETSGLDVDGEDLHPLMRNPARLLRDHPHLCLPPLPPNLQRCQTNSRLQIRGSKTLEGCKTKTLMRPVTEIGWRNRMRRTRIPNQDGEGKDLGEFATAIRNRILLSPIETRERLERKIKLAW